MEPRRRNPLRRYPTAVCISVLHFGLTSPRRELSCLSVIAAVAKSRHKKHCIKSSHQNANTKQND